MRTITVIAVVVVAASLAASARAQDVGSGVRLDARAQLERDHHGVELEYGAAGGVFLGAVTVGALGLWMMTDGSLVGGTEAERTESGIGLVLVPVAALALVGAIVTLIVAIVHDLAWHRRLEAQPRAGEVALDGAGIRVAL